MSPVYGWSTTAGQDVGVGNYTDTVVVTLEIADFAEVLEVPSPEVPKSSKCRSPEVLKS